MTSKDNIISETLIIGDSIIRDISERGLNNVTVRTLSAAARIEDVGRSIKVNRSGMSTFKNVILHVGTNNCTASGGLNRARDDYRDLLRVLGEVSPGAALVASTVCPRKDSPDCQSRVDRLNLAIKDVAKEEGWAVVDNDNNFKMKDESADPSLLDKGGLQLTQAGTLRLLRNFQAAVPSIMRENGKSKNKRLNQKRRTPVRKKVTENRHNGRTGSDNWRGHNSNHRHFREPNRIRSPVKQPCKNCGEKNHSANRCKFGEPLICHNCFGLGHKSWMCTVVRRRTRSKRSWKVH